MDFGTTTLINAVNDALAALKAEVDAILAELAALSIKDAVFSWPGDVTSLVGTMSGPFQLLTTTVFNMTEVSAAVPNNTDADLTVGFYLNGSEFASVTITSGTTQATATGPWPTGGSLTDVLQASIDTYSGSGASDLVAQIVVKR